MTIDMFGALLLYACVTTFSPGPNNILLLSMAGEQGFFKCLKLMLGIWTGFFLVMICCGLSSAGLSKVLPGITPYFKYAGGIYILWLAWKTVTRRPAEAGDGKQKPPSFMMGFLLQMVNVKIILYGIAAFTSFILPYEQAIPALIGYAFLLMAAGAAGNITWALLGNICQRFYAKYYRIFNIAMALLLIWCAMKILLV